MRLDITIKHPTGNSALIDLARPSVIAYLRPGTTTVWVPPERVVVVRVREASFLPFEGPYLSTGRLDPSVFSKCSCEVGELVEDEIYRGDDLDRDEWIARKIALGELVEKARWRYHRVGEEDTNGQ